MAVICTNAFLLCVDELRRLLERRYKTAETGAESGRTVTHCFRCTQTYAALPKAAAGTPPRTKTSSFLGRLPLYSSVIHHLLRGQASIAAQRRLTGPVIRLGFVRRGLRRVLEYFEKSNLPPSRYKRTSASAAHRDRGYTCPRWSIWRPRYTF
jgi:hypothetical protein